MYKLLVSILLSSTLCFGVSLSSITRSAAQSVVVERRAVDKRAIDLAPRFGAGYFAEQLTHPGVFMSYDYPLRARAITVTKRRGAKVIEKRSVFVARPSLGLWVHPGNSVGALPTADVEYRRTRGRFMWLAGLGGGYVKTLRLGTTFVATENPEVFEEKHLRGEGSPVVSGVLGIGIDNSVGGSRLSYILRMRPIYQIQSNASGRVRAFGEIGVSWAPGATPAGQR